MGGVGETLLRGVRAVAFPALLALAVLLLWRMRSANVDVVVATAVSWTTMLVVLIVLERIIPFERAWHVPDGQLGNDFAHTFFGSAVGSRVGGLAVETLAVALAGAPIFAAQAWPSTFGGLPLVAQVAIAFVVVDVVRYAQHRAQHAFAPLWSMHVLHHDPRRLIAVKAGRSHILDRAMQALCTLPIVVAGAPVDVVFYCVGINSLVGLIAHANIDVARGFLLRFVVVGPREHRVHHGFDVAHHDANYGASLIVWDRLFGTFVDDAEVRRVGLEESTPDGVLAQLAAPVARHVQ